MNRWSLLIASLSLCHGGGAALLAGHPDSGGHFVAAGACGPGGCGGSAHGLPYGWSGCGPHFAGPFGPVPEMCPHCPGHPHYCAPHPVPVYGGTYRGTYPHDPVPFLWDFSYKLYYSAYYPPRSDYAISYHAVGVPAKGKPKGKAVAPPGAPGKSPERLPGPGGGGGKPPVKPAGPDGGL
jgi:hypothetical protein